MGDDLDARARAILRANDRGGYTVPTAGLYPHQWNWDSAFAALGFAEFDLDRAWRELETLFRGQWPNGMVPHIQFHDRSGRYFPGPELWGCGASVPSSGLSQPPVAASMARRIWERDRRAGEARMRALFPKLVAWHRWFVTWRTDRGAVCATHPWESGRDNAPEWDEALAGLPVNGIETYERTDTKLVDTSMRPTDREYDRYLWLVRLGKSLGWDEAALAERNPFRVADPGLTFVLLRANRDLVELAEALGEPAEELRAWNAALERGAASLWNDALGSYDARDVRSGRWAGCISSASFLCWYAGIDDERMLAQLRRIGSSVRYCVPSHDCASERFDGRRYWRGPAWGMMNALIARGLKEAGHAREAERIRADTAELIAGGGFYEYFDPRDGASAGGGEFSWTAAIWLDWASPNARPD